MNKILDCNRRIENYANAYVLVGEGLKRIGEDKALLLKDVYINQMSLVDHADRLGLSLTASRRKAREALLGFARACKVQGYGEEWFYARFGKDMLFDKIKERIDERERRSNAKLCVFTPRSRDRTQRRERDLCQDGSISL